MYVSACNIQPFTSAHVVESFSRCKYTPKFMQLNYKTHAPSRADSKINEKTPI